MFYTIGTGRVKAPHRSSRQTTQQPERMEHAGVLLAFVNVAHAGSMFTHASIWATVARQPVSVSSRASAMHAAWSS